MLMENLARQIERTKYGYPVAADEFAADSVTRISARFSDAHRHVSLPQQNSKRKPRQATTYDGDFLHAATVGPQ